jgi:putative ABC transport system substrate-binding protein
MKHQLIGNGKRLKLAACAGIALFLVLVQSVQAQQQGKISRIGYLTFLPNADPLESVFLQALHDLGYDEGRNIHIEYRRAGGKVDRLSPLAEELIHANVDLIVVRSTPVAEVAKNATTRIPIVMVGVADPVRTGFVTNLAHPGGNITGMSNMMPELAGKRLELLTEVRPKLAQVAFLAYSPDPLHKIFVNDAQAAAERFKIQIKPVVINTVEQIETSFLSMVKEDPGALIVQPLFISNLRQGQKIAQLALKHRLPAVSDGIPFADEGGLLFYGPDQRPMFQRAATYVDKILKGAKPGDLPVEQPTKFELVINLRTAKQIGLIIPPNVLARADRVIK